MPNTSASRRFFCGFDGLVPERGQWCAVAFKLSDKNHGSLAASERERKERTLYFYAFFRG